MGRVGLLGEATSGPSCTDELENCTSCPGGKYSEAPLKDSSVEQGIIVSSLSQLSVSKKRHLSLIFIC